LPEAVSLVRQTSSVQSCSYPVTAGKLIELLDALLPSGQLFYVL